MVPMVASWAHLGTETMREAMSDLGLSAEKAARQVPTTERTWRRWVIRGEVPRHVLARVAEILQLEIETPARRPVAVVADEGGEVARMLDEVIERLDRIERAILRDGRDPPP
jgi:hypothetical protein